jgi:putative GTP pyrophosphokinase
MALIEIHSYDPTDSYRKEYDQRYDKYQRLKDEIQYILKRELEAQQIPYHSLEGRIKTFDSFIDKARRQEQDKPFETIYDICGVRIICLFLSDIERIGRIIESNFVIHKKDDKISNKPEEAFGYLSIHYVGSLSDSCSGPRYNDLKGLNFEIQLRTIAMHAWSTISHYLDYKSPHAIPSHLRKDFNALSALFYVADSHFELFFRSSQEAKKIAEEKAQDFAKIEEEEINLDTLTAYLHNKYPDREHANASQVSELVESLVAGGYNYISQLESVLKRSESDLKEYEKNKPDIHLWDIGAVRISLYMLRKKSIERSPIDKT